LSFDLPDFSVGADVDITALEPDVTIPPVMLNSHVTNLRPDIDVSARGRLVKLFSPPGWVGCPIRWISALRLAKTRHIRAAYLLSLWVIFAGNNAGPLGTKRYRHASVT